LASIGVLKAAGNFIPQVAWSFSYIWLKQHRMIIGAMLFAIAIAEGFLQILDKFPDTALLLPLHRNPTVRVPLQELLGNHPRIFLTEPLDYGELVAAIGRSHLLLK
jgi:UDP-N-acetylglucosamine 2-epimerase